MRLISLCHGYLYSAPTTEIKPELRKSKEDRLVVSKGGEGAEDEMRGEDKKKREKYKGPEATQRTWTVMKRSCGRPGGDYSKSRTAFLLVAGHGCTVVPITLPLTRTRQIEGAAEYVDHSSSPLLP